MAIAAKRAHLKQGLQTIKPKYLVAFESKKYAGATKAQIPNLIKWSECNLTEENIHIEMLDPFSLREEAESEGGIGNLTVIPQMISAFYNIKNMIDDENPGEKIE